MGINRNYKWTEREIVYHYQKENPDWTRKECQDKAKVIYRELNRLNRQLKYNNNKYYKKFVPLSMFENEKGEYSFHSTDRTEDDYYR